MNLELDPQTIYETLKQYFNLIKGVIYVFFGPAGIHALWDMVFEI